ncbi:MAG: acyl-CoA-binding protein [Pseudomonadota bacterium]
MSDDLKTRFETALAAAKNLTERPSNDDLLELYALYKQSTAGDVSGDRPGLLDFVGGAKFDAWRELKGMASDDAMARYVEKVNALKG